MATARPKALGTADSPVRRARRYMLSWEAPAVSAEDMTETTEDATQRQ